MFRVKQFRPQRDSLQLAAMLVDPDLVAGVVDIERADCISCSNGSKRSTWISMSGLQSRGSNH